MSNAVGIYHKSGKTKDCEIWIEKQDWNNNTEKGKLCFSLAAGNTNPEAVSAGKCLRNRHENSKGYTEIS